MCDGSGPYHYCCFQKNWSLGRDNYYYFGTEEKKRDDTLPSSELAEQAIEYARELEMIV